MFFLLFLCRLGVQTETRLSEVGRGKGAAAQGPGRGPVAVETSVQLGRTSASTAGGRTVGGGVSRYHHGSSRAGDV